MASNLIEMFQNTVGDLLVKESSGLLGETSESTSSALKAVAPALLTAIAHKGDTDEGAVSLLKYLNENNIDGSILSGVAGMLGGNIETEKLMYSGAVLLRFLLNDRLSPVVDLIAGSSGLKTSSATSLLKLTAPFLLGIVGKQVQEKGLDAQGLKSLLIGQKDYIKATIPKGLDTALGLNTNLQATKQPSGPSATESIEKSAYAKWLPWAVLILAALGLYYLVQKGCGKTAEVPVDITPDTTAVTKTETDNPFKTYSLPDGQTIRALPGSFTGKLAEFLAGKEEGEQCITFDKVSFENGSFKIAAGSEIQLRQLATILKAYPDARIRLEGHTDEEGDSGKNKNLSKERAKVIKTWLTDQEIAPGRIDVKGWGEEKPVASNDTKAGREKNRRIEVCLNKKQ